MASRDRARASDRHRREDRHAHRARPHTDTSTTTNSLSTGALAQLDAINQKLERNEQQRHSPRRHREEDSYDEEARARARRAARREERRRRKEAEEDHNHYREKRRARRVVSGPLLEDGEYEPRQRRTKNEYQSIGPGSTFEDEDARKRRKRKWIWIGIGVFLLILIIAIIVGVAVSKKHSLSNSPTPAQAVSTTPSTASLQGISQDSIPQYAQGTFLDPFTWYDTTDFNVTFTNDTVGGLSLMGLNSTWNDDARANSNVPPLKESWQYGTRVIRGVNIGGWLSIEPFITPSLFTQFPSSQGVVDECTLSQTLGPSQAKTTIEKHYASFITEQDFINIQAAGFDHVRIPYPYWAVTTYSGDPYVPNVSWRYLLRGLEWARKYGIRVNLDLHALPGSQNGWNHSGRQGSIGWLNGTDGTLNAQRSLDIHRQLSTFFAQPRYANLVTMYGLVNEPRMVSLVTSSVISWTESAINIVRASGMPNSTIIVIGDGFLGLPNWHGLLTGYPNILLDAHQYVVFNNDQLSLPHTPKLTFACQNWAQQTTGSMSTETGFGSFLCGEFSQADTDCQAYLNDVGFGNRWEGTLNMNGLGANVLTPQCPTQNSPRCDCSSANADPSRYSAEYKQWLMMFAEAQMQSYELGWGWFYWTWKTESATQWDYSAGMAAGILPTNVQAKRSFVCGSTAVPNFEALGLSEAY